MLEEDSRYERWIKVSVGLMRFEPHMMPLVQQLGRLDVRLIQEDSRWIKATHEEEASLENGEALHEHITQCYLWVLGSYEVVRTLCEMMRSGKEKVPDEVADLFQKTKKRFARLRMPLAKMAPASGFAHEDSHIAYPGLHQEYGVAWRLEVARLERLGATVVSRNDGWVVMQAPTGHRFCVGSPYRGGFDQGANAWE